MLRFVLSPDLRVVPDIDHRLPGRGVWVQAERAAMLRACARGAFARAFRREVHVPDGLSDQVERLLRRRMIDLIGLANRAGEAVFGFDKCRQWLAAGRCAVLVSARNGSLAERARLRGRHRVPEVALLSAAELGQAIGRPEIVHAVIAPGRLAERLMVEARRLGGIIGCDAALSALSKECG
jgi:predicted RNA-binding protein YlxR (DUF448 family)